MGQPHSKRPMQWSRVLGFAPSSVQRGRPAQRSLAGERSAIRRVRLTWRVGGGSVAPNDSVWHPVAPEGGAMLRQGFGSLARGHRWLMLCAVGVAACFVVAAPAAGKPSGSGPGNSPNAKACQKDNWMNLVRSDETAFASEEECTSYAAGGGTLQPKPTATAQSICEDAGGTFTTGGVHPPGYGGLPLVWSCLSIPDENYDDAVATALRDQCFNVDGGSHYGFGLEAGAVDARCYE